MNCWQVKRRLLRLSPEDLRSPSSPALARHLDKCPECYAQSQMYCRLNDDLPLGAEFNPPNDYWDGWSVPDRVANRSNMWSRLWNRIDWLIMPEASLRWATAAVMIFFGTVGGINLQQRINSQPIGLPNRLEFHSQFVGVAENYNDGFLLMRKTSSIQTDAKNAEKTTQVNDRI